MKKYSVLFIFFVLFTQVNIAQEVRVIDNKGTIQKVNNNNVTYSDTAPTSPVEGDIWYDTNTSPSILKIRDGAIWRSLPSSNWDLTGNSGATAANFLGTIDDVRMQIRSNNLPMLEFGRRATLGLVATQIDYTDGNQPLVHLNGDGNTSALQFAASGAGLYKPMFFTTTNGSFRLKGSAGDTDIFEIGSAGPANDGRLEFVIGDDGHEPIVFKRFYYPAGSNSEMFRVQGSNTTTTAKTRFGININPALVAVDATYDSSPSANMANSTLQINGSVSKSILTTTTALLLNEDHHTIVLGGNHAITLPAANLSEGRIYVIKNPNTFATTISAYVNNNGDTGIVTINNSTTLWLQSDGTRWQQISNTTSEPTVYTGYFIIAAPGGSSTSTTSQTINGLPFKPSQITFTAHANVESLNFSDNGSSNNDVNNSFGTMNGFARTDGVTTTQQVIYVGGSGQSINDISRFASNSNCIGIRYGNQDAADLGTITASLTSFNTNGFTISATHTRTNNNLFLNESLVVLYTAYK